MSKGIVGEVNIEVVDAACLFETLWHFQSEKLRIRIEWIWSYS